MTSQLSATSKAFVADYTVPILATLTTAISDVEAAYTNTVKLLTPTERGLISEQAYLAAPSREIASEAQSA
jgi:hypothetical protein